MVWRRAARRRRKGYGSLLRGSKLDSLLTTNRLAGRDGKNIFCISNESLTSAAAAPTLLSPPAGRSAIGAVGTGASSLDRLPALS